jgi:sugar lactone lactonase YvrE
VLLALALATVAPSTAAPPAAQLAPRTTAVNLGKVWEGMLRLRSTKAKASLTLRLGKERVAASLRRVGPGVFHARAKLPAIGQWQASVRLGGRTIAVGSVTVRPALTAAADVAVLADGALLVADLGGYVFRGRPGGGVVPVARLSFAVEVVLDPQGGFGVVSGERFVSRVAGGRVQRLARMDQPTALAFDRAGNVFVSELSGRIRRIDADTRAVTVIAGIGGQGFSGDGGPATSAQLNQPHGLVVGADGSIVFCDTLNDRLRRIDPAGRITTLATGFRAPGDVTATPGGGYYVADYGNNRIAHVTPGGAVSTIGAVDRPNSVAAGDDGAVFFTEGTFPRVRGLDPKTHTVTTVLGR